MRLPTGRERRVSVRYRASHKAALGHDRTLARAWRFSTSRRSFYTANIASLEVSDRERSDVPHLSGLAANTLMIYEISPKHFGLTTGRQLLFAVGSLACFALVVFVPSWISASDPWSWRDVFTALLTWFFLGIWWYWQYSYSIEVDVHSIRSGRRVVRKGHVRYLREIEPLFGGRRLVLSEHGPAWVHLRGGVIEIPKGIPEYEQIKTKIFTWER